MAERARRASAMRTCRDADVAELQGESGDPLARRASVNSLRGLARAATPVAPALRRHARGCAGADRDASRRVLCVAGPLCGELMPAGGCGVVLAAPLPAFTTAGVAVLRAGRVCHRANLPCPGRLRRADGAPRSIAPATWARGSALSVIARSFSPLNAPADRLAVVAGVSAAPVKSAATQGASRAPLTPSWAGLHSPSRARRPADLPRNPTVLSGSNQVTRGGPSAAG